MTEDQITKQLHQWFKEGATARQQGTVCPYAGRSLAAQIHMYGWVQEDLRLALIKADPTYAASQKAVPA